MKIQKLQLRNNIELLNFVNLSLDEKKMVLDWRNHPNIKKWMYTQEDITLNNHLKFLEQLAENKDKLYFLVKKNQKFIGVVDFYNFYNKTSAEFGLYSNPYNKIPGVGRILEEVAIDYAFKNLKIKKLKLEVFAENIQVINLHKKYKFVETSSKIINNKKVICMELINENK
jgi:UDP-4-amino-4,6-dideoxy-N-acetyl-beta-L-altrosamine N-acetyltransferase